MRLLNAKTYRFEEFFEPKVSEYAILSYRWGFEEVTYADILSGNFRLKVGFAKIRNACQQALKDGLKYVWIDTCCIDSISTMEVSEAVNSMFRWYRQSKVCYTFLSDVNPAIGSFSNSVWFNRGWTLQELIAPDDVVFYGYCWDRLGSRSSLMVEISAVTQIPLEVLRSGHNRPPLASFSVAQRMSWAAGRETSRIEDRAYSLLGIFGVNMVLLYGEGSRAYLRLQEQVLMETSDLSILAWNRATFNSQLESSESLLATSPDEFTGCSDVLNTSFENNEDQRALTLTKTGLSIERPMVIYAPDKLLYLSLNCGTAKEPSKVVALRLKISDHHAMICHITRPNVQDDVGGMGPLVSVKTLDPKPMAELPTLTIRTQYQNVARPFYPRGSLRHSLCMDIPSSTSGSIMLKVASSANSCWDYENLVWYPATESSKLDSDPRPGQGPLIWSRPLSLSLSDVYSCRDVPQIEQDNMFWSPCLATSRSDLFWELENSDGELTKKIYPALQDLCFERRLDAR